LNSPLGDPSLTSDQDGASQPFLSDPEERQTPGEAGERLSASETLLDDPGEISDALADSGQEAGEDGKAFTAEEDVIQRTSADEPGSVPRTSSRPRPRIASPRLEQRDSPSPDIARDTDQFESSGEIRDVIQDARQEPGEDHAALHAEDRAPDG